ncbi:MAG: hypothetical protein N2746_05450 [Deltaproteobacteria bacterium]|nr:hypothetical protein [Deltaproteobacteria bacterium]
MCVGRDKIEGGRRLFTYEMNRATTLLMKIRNEIYELLFKLIIDFASLYPATSNVIRFTGACMNVINGNSSSQSVTLNKRLNHSDE